jgi:hypothetical protein
MRVRVSIAVEVDVEAWAAEYHLEPAEVRADVLAHIRMAVNESVAPMEVVA